MNKCRYKKIFFIVGFIFIIIFFLSLILSHGETLKHYLFADTKDTFMDFFNSLYDTIGRKPYERGVIYPPICYLIYFIFLRMIPIEQLTVSAREFRMLQGPTYAFFIYFLITFLAFIFLTRKMKKGKELEKNLFTLLMIFSVPFLFAFERANIIFLSLILLMFFFIFKDSNNKILKELSLVSLAFSATVKIYPAIFGIVLLKEKRYKEIFRVIIYGLILFFIPFLLFGGLTEFSTFFHNLTNTTNDFQQSLVINKLNFMAVVDLIINKLNLKSNIVPTIFKIIYVFVILISCVNSLVTKSNYKRVLLLTLLMIIVPGISFTYTAIFLIIPVIMMIDDENKKTSIDYIYLILLILIMFPNPICLFENGDVNHFFTKVSWNTMIMSTCIIIMTFMLNIEIIINIIKQNKKKLIDN